MRLKIGDNVKVISGNDKGKFGKITNLMKPFVTVEGINIELTPNEQIIIPEALAWLDASVKERMECGDHWVIYP